MLQILINGQEAVLKSGTQIKLTRENPFFSEAGDYTLDVTFPLAGCAANQRIFGAVHRPEMSRKALLGQSYNFILNASMLTLSGRAAVTAVSEEEVKVQLLGGKSAFNFDSETDEGKEMYIDELPLSIIPQCIYTKSWEWTEANMQEYIDSFANADWLPGKNNLLPALLISKAFTPLERNRYMFGSSDDTDCVFFPVFSEDDESWSNPIDYRYWGDDVDSHQTWRMDMETYFFRLKAGKNYPLPHSAAPGAYLFQELHVEDGKWVDDDFVVAPQPYLCIVVERIFEALGYTLRPEDNAIRQGAFKNVFVVNSRNSEQMVDVLPHWTVKEFFDNLQKFLNVIIKINGTSVSVVSRNTAYADSAFTVLNHVIDEHSTDLDEDSETNDPTSGNIGYQFPDELIAKNALGERYQQVEIRRMNSYAEIEADLATLNQATKLESNILYIDMSTGERYYIHYNADTENLVAGTFELKTIDLMGPLWRTSSESIDTELKFVPCRMADYWPTYRTKMLWGETPQKYVTQTPYPIHPENIELDGGQYGGFHIPYFITSDVRQSVKENKLNLYNEVFRDTDEESETETEESTGKRDVIELGYNAAAEHYFCYVQTYRPLANTTQEVSVQIEYPVGIPHYLDRFGNWKDEGEHFFYLRNNTGQVGQELNGAALNIDTRSVTQFQFTDGIFDPSAVVLIRGRKYVCQKLEITIDENGLQPMKRGYFYEVG